MSPSFSSPYNITISNDSPTITYFPYRDGPAAGGWNLTCADSIDSAWIPQSFCAGLSSHRTTYIGASLLIEFEGTAAYLYGETSGSFVTQVDGQVNGYPLASDSAVALLAKSEGLSFGKHRIFLNVTQSAALSFKEAVLTIGVGNADRGSYDPRNRTLTPFTRTSDGLTTLNPQFTFTGTWYSNGGGAIGATGNVVYPRQDTPQTGAYMTFELTNTSAFFVYGLVNFDLGAFSVELTPPYGLGSPVTTFYNSNAHWISLDRVMYWASGMDRDKGYSVKITNLGQGGDLPSQWDFSHIDIIDAGPTSRLFLLGLVEILKSTTNNSTPSAGSGVPPDAVSSGKRHRVPFSIIGSVIGAIVVVFLLLLGFLYYRRNMRTKFAATTSNTPRHPGVQPRQLNDRPPPASLSISDLPTRPYPAPGGLVMLAWDDVGPSGQSGFDQAAVNPGGHRIVQEEDAGALPTPGENVTRLPPNYKEIWSHERS
ncbi:hypothetical protein GALMADRAFT_152167 [Galerina marginata CBS 339.88]|uniref:Uncharacterized protein n=1 Tax=Galerina marginata (strain CBS 339.88) TaxID=685588 RepID=A0A067TTH4_GALM3|nr:hypothetical protein GALMADRAFT_152167 [Galerina marginata CBS 339.88]